MPRKKNSLAETSFIISSADSMTDEDAAKAYHATFGKTITVAALRKRRQRLGLKKRGWDGQFKLEDK